MAALSTLVTPVQEEPRLADVMLRHEIVMFKEPVNDNLPANCCILN